jgi:predicted phosphodiesterase
MRVFALSDIHVDYEDNARWITNLSAADYQHDVLILAGDVTDKLRLLGWCLGTLAKRFHRVLFVPGNHELWVMREGDGKHSLQKFDDVCAVAASSGASTRPFRRGGVSIFPLLAWYDNSFGEPSEELRSMWMDYRACRWPPGLDEKDVAAHFAALNEPHVPPAGDTVVTFSHFVPRLDVMPAHIPPAYRVLYPILGCKRLERQLRELDPRIHVYGHSHVNRHVTLGGVTYVNNAFGYPSETRISSKRLLCIHEC